MLDVRRASFRSMGTDVTVIAHGDAGPFGRAVAVVRAVFEREDRRFSRFRADSELSHVNARSGRWTEVSAPFADVVRLALAGWFHSRGRFDPTVLDAVIAAGYDRDFDEVLAGGRGALRPPMPCGRAAEVSVTEGRLRLPEGVGLDLGGIAKGWTADLAAETVVGGGLEWVLVNAGGDLRLAGSPPEGVDVGLEDPEVADAIGGRLILTEGALATSSVTRRAWGEGLHHVIDPATARPANGAVIQATAWAPTCAQAEIHATQALLQGPPFLERAAAILWLADGRILTNLVSEEVLGA